MKVSIIVPVYNTARYLRQCLQSLKDQTLKEIEIICVNDGSTDESYEIIEEYTSCDFRFKAIHKVNTGYGHSVNTGIQAAQSPYIGIVESDDFAERSMFQNLYNAAENAKADFVKGNYNEYCNDSSCPVTFEEMLGAFPYGQVISPEETPGIFGVHPSVWASLYRKSFLEENDIQFLETPGASYQDMAFAFKVNACAKRVAFIREAVLNYRVDNVDSSVHHPQKIFCVCDELREIDRYIEEKGKAQVFEKDWLKKLHQISAWVKFRNYVWNYVRLSLPYQYAFLMKVRDELREVRQSGCDLEVWNTQEKENLDQMVDTPDAFFQVTGKGYVDSRLSMIPVLNHSFSISCFQELVAEFQDIYIYGAGRIGQRVYSCLKRMNAGYRIKGFVVSEQDNNPEQLEDKPIVVLSEMQKQDALKALVIVAVHRRFQLEIALKLQSEGYENILLIDEQIKSWIYKNTEI